MVKTYKLHHGTFTLSYYRLSGFCTMPDRFYPDEPEEFSIVIDDRERGKALLDTLIHELLHAEHPDMSEEEVARTATNIAEVLHAEGFRHKPKRGA